MDQIGWFNDTLGNGDQRQNSRTTQGTAAKVASI